VVSENPKIQGGTIFCKLLQPKAITLSSALSIQITSPGYSSKNYKLPGYPGNWILDIGHTSYIGKLRLVRIR
jgi:hypothetical protein